MQRLELRPRVTAQLDEAKQTGCVKDARGALERCRRRSEEESSTAARLPTSKAVDTAGGGASTVAVRGCWWQRMTREARGLGK